MFIMNIPKKEQYYIIRRLNRRFEEKHGKITRRKKQAKRSATKGHLTAAQSRIGSICTRFRQIKEYFQSCYAKQGTPNKDLLQNACTAYVSIHQWHKDKLCAELEKLRQRLAARCHSEQELRHKISFFLPAFITQSRECAFALATLKEAISKISTRKKIAKLPGKEYKAYLAVAGVPLSAITMPKEEDYIILEQ